MHDYEQLYRLDVLGLEDTSEGDKHTVYTEFKEQLHQSTQSWYQAGLPWKPNNPTLHNNKNWMSCPFIQPTFEATTYPALFKLYDDKIKEQLVEGIVKEAPGTTTSKEFCIPHKPVVKQSAETTKLWIVHDTSAKPTKASPSLNECLEVGPVLQNTLWNVLTRCRLKPVAIIGVLKQVFLKIMINKNDRDALRFHWIKDREILEIVVLQFMRLMFGLSRSPLVFKGTIKHLEWYEQDQPQTVILLVWLCFYIVIIHYH